ncbi:DUF393 domain-containing protein [Rhodobacterales bacterium HKCCE3408]|nr:DUF393 domain-containing protein [Rhodobacterales bacterium HKCCE3408]
MPRVFSRDIPPALDGLGPVAVMDATCAICSFGARMIHRLDRTGAVRILPVQTDLGAEVLRFYGLTPYDPETWLFIDGAVWRDFDAMIVAGAKMGGLGYLLTPLRLLPAFIRDWLYRRLARNRYALFGRADLCAIPDPGLRARLLP